MAVKARFYQEGNCIDYTPSSAGTAGDIVSYGSLAGMLVDSVAAGVPTSLRVRGILKMKKGSGTFAIGNNVGWDNDGTDVDGNTGGCVTNTYASIDFMLGRVIAAAAGNATDCYVDLNRLSPQAITDSSAGTAATSIATVNGGGTNYSVINDNFATVYKILKNANIID